MVDTTQDLPKFRLPPKVRKGIEAGWKFSLTREDVAFLESAVMATIYRRHQFQERRGKRVRWGPIPPDAKSLAAFAKKIYEARKILIGCERRGVDWPRRNALTAQVSLVPEFDAAVLPFTDVVEPAARKIRVKVPKVRNSKNEGNEGWGHLINAAILIFRDHGRPPTSNARRSGHHTSALLRGLEPLFNALPPDVTAGSMVSCLGSPAAELIKQFHRRRKRHEGDRDRVLPASGESIKKRK